MGIQYNPRIVTDGLVLALDAGNTKSYPGSGTTWTDISGSGNNGTLTNGPTYSSANGGSIVFDGSNDYVSFADTSSTSSVGDGSFTLSAFVKVNSSGTNKNIWRRDNFLNQGAENRRVIVLAILPSGYPAFGVSDGSSNNAVYSQNICDGLWHHLVAVYISSTKTEYIYENGILRVQAVYNNTQSFNTARQPWNMGLENNLSFSEPYTGNIAQASIYNRALSAAEVSQNYNALRSRFSI